MEWEDEREAEMEWWTLVFFMVPVSHIWSDRFGSVPFDIGLIADILNSDKIEVGCIYDRQKGNKRQIFMKGESCDFAAEHGLISLNVLLANG